MHTNTGEKTQRGKEGGERGWWNNFDDVRSSTRFHTKFVLVKRPDRECSFRLNYLSPRVSFHPSFPPPRETKRKAGGAR